MRNKKNIRIGAPNIEASGGFLIGKPVEDVSTIPEDATSDLPAEVDAQPGGYVSEDGLTKTVDRSTEKIKDWNGDVIHITQTDHSVSLKFTCLEAANRLVLKMLYGENAKVTDGKVIAVESSEELPPVSLDFRLNGGPGRKGRVTAPHAVVTSVGDVNYLRSGLVRYEVEVEALDVDGSGRKLWEIWEDDGSSPDPVDHSAGDPDSADDPSPDLP